MIHCVYLCCALLWLSVLMVECMYFLSVRKFCEVRWCGEVPCSELAVGALVLFAVMVAVIFGASVALGIW